MNKNKTILITGASGFLGSHVLRRLVASGYKVVGLKRASSNLWRLKGLKAKVKFYDIETANLAQVFLEHKIGTVVHCATNYGLKAASSLEVLEANLMLPLKILKTGQDCGLKCFINTDTILDKRINDYSLSKSQFRQWLETFSQKIVCLNIEIEHFYGPGDNASKFVTKVVKELLSKAAKIDLTKGEQKRSFIYIDDVVSAFMLILSSHDNDKAGFYNYQVGAKNTVRIKDFVEKVKKFSANKETSLNFGAIPYRKNEIMDIKLELKPLEKLGWRQKVSLEKGIKKVIAFESRG